MMNERSYRFSLIFAIFFHISLIFLLMYESSSSRPVMRLDTKNELGQTDQKLEHQEIIHAVSVNQKQVMAAVEHLKAEKARQQLAEQQHQRQLKQQAEAARQQRLAEQQQLAHLKQEALKLKQESVKLAHEREQQRLKEEHALKELALLQKNQEQKLKKMQLESKRLLEVKKNNEHKLAQQQVEKALLAKKSAESAAAQRADSDKKNALAAAKQTRMIGEVNKYKAMILQAISRQWILPEHYDSRLASKFNIRLAPNGTVLEVSLIHSSGDVLLDRSAQLAIYKASPFPVPHDVDTFNIFRDISLTVRPEQGA